ncbi:polymer-forming cytoskeletal protein [Bradyrhizobium sp. LHD-71]|uniref:bactofilin family protein n=1 Tax=Bradyrhizobium sp. LHD-71 TaxID=3072141 RepID=UPI00280FD218|nr:polymer-forming cytoskeletal protein [Bradyrhizobium sp. LHD-71]MDQ8730978.1 polymer-forming cytoskeletal protein [Bradyrhizobium sp. LHD-71]
MLERLRGDMPKDQIKDPAPFATKVAGTVQQLQSSATAQPAETPAPANAYSAIHSDTTITGKVRTSGVIKISGRIEGELNAESAEICEGAQIDGTIIARELTIRGRVKGTIHAMRVRLLSTAVVEGDIFHRTLSIEEEALFEGTSKRQENPTEVSSNLQAERKLPHHDSQSIAPMDAIGTPETMSKN